MRSKRHRVITLEGLPGGTVGLSDVEWELLAFVEFDIDHTEWVKNMEVDGALPGTRTTLSFHSSGTSGETDCASYEFSVFQSTEKCAVLVGGQFGCSWG